MDNILISGYFGFDNLGDEAILAAVIKGLTDLRSDVSITVLSESPEVTRTRYGVAAVRRDNYWQVIKAIRDCQLFVSGGGSLLQDVTGWKSIPYYLGLLKIAQLFGKNTAILAQGIGPINKSYNKFLTGQVLKKTDIITVRDQNSRRRLQQLGIKENRIKVTVDPVFILEDEAVESGGAGNLDSGQRPVIGIVPRFWHDDSYLNNLAEALIGLNEIKPAEFVIIPFHVNEDGKTAHKLQQLMKKKSREPVVVRTVIPPAAPGRALPIFDELQLVVGVRLHSLIFAVLKGLPVVGISYDPKVDAFLESIDRSAATTIEEINPTSVTAAIKNILDNYERERQNIMEARSNFSQSAHRNLERILTSLKAQV